LDLLLILLDQDGSWAQETFETVKCTKELDA